MKSLGKKGFTLIELLAVITIMGILMLVAIPAVSRTIENSRRDTYATLAKQYITTVRNAVLADELTCGSGTNWKTVGSMPNGTYYFKINTEKQTGDKEYISTQTSDIMEKVGKSSWSNADVNGYVKWVKTQTGSGETANTKTTYSIALVDTGKHGIATETVEDSITRTSVSTNTASNTVTMPSDTGIVECKLK